MKKLIIFMAVLALAAGTAMALTVADASFEDAGCFTGSMYVYVADGTSGWTDASDEVSGGNAWIFGLIYNSGKPQVTHSGCNMMEEGGIKQIITGAVIGPEYELSIYAAGDDDTEGWTAYIDGVSLGFQATSGTIPQIVGDWDLLTWIFVAPATSFELKLLGGETAWIDDVSITLPYIKASDPDPSHGQINVPLDPNLSWTMGLDPTTTAHKLYMSGGKVTDPNLYFVATIPVVGNDPNGRYSEFGDWLDRDGTYYWRVDEVTGSGDITGNVWMFKTLPSTPFFDPALPADILHDALGGNATFTVSATNPYTLDSTGMTYQWYKAPSTPKGTGTTTLNINPVVAGDIGDYYCKVTITSTSATADSRAARLDYKRLMHNWKFDGDLTDSIGTVNGTGDPNFIPGIAYVPGIEGSNAIKFYGIESVLLGAAGDVSIGARDFTVSVWANTAAPPTWASFISNKNWDSGGNPGWGLFDNSGDMNWNIADTAYSRADVTFPTVYYDPNVDPNGQWHLITATNDSDGLARVYVDGVLAASADISYITETKDSGLPITVGKDGNGGYPYIGLIDDVRIYNYVLDPVAVAVEYNRVTGESICVEYPAMDFTGPEDVPDCQVDILDLKEWAGTWLDCNRFPAVRCQE